MIERELNARALEYSEVGEKFVVHPTFERLTSLNNCLVIGPRGSGKTTMLRMLTPEALHHWNPLDSKELQLKKAISFAGIYIPMSRIFQDDLEQRFKESSLDIAKKENVMFQIYYLNIVESILELVYFLMKNNGLDREQEMAAVGILNVTLGTNFLYCYTINSLIREVSRLKLATRQKLNEKSIVTSTDFKKSLISNIEPILKAVNEIFDFKPSQKYALCFDELDVYASEFTAEMIKNLRGVSPNIMLKLSLAPIHSVNISEFLDPPQQIHDYEKIHLWPNPGNSDVSGSKEEKKYQKFSQKLAVQTLSEIVKSKVNLDLVLGSHSFKDVFKFIKTSETENNIFRNENFDIKSDPEIERFIFLKLADLDPKFKSFLNENKVYQLGSKSINRGTSSQFVRKLKEIIFNRVINIKTDGKKNTFNTRKIPVQYHGKEMILNAMDGNPRYLKKLMEYLAEYISPDFPNERIPIVNQALALKKVNDLFFQRVEAIPQEDDKVSVIKLIKKIGDYFSYRMNLSRSWNTTSFPSYVKIPEIDKVNVYENAFKKAINNGALLIVGETDLTKLNSVALKEVRLNYLLHIHFKIPIRKYYQVSFEKVIRDDTTPSLFEHDQN
ncbi:hypothetical protein [Dyadobacter sp. CY351]|uniref:ORC-CDC6 family AAA ATPase n=1 Tax=Dyadobacter sp. CY351 TaxID=2909337 RepID=UPI001F35EE14|nr:hypothetical protein [Dyadobacter sp. CY351]MCF2521113.1 hypothetical protein [Dyadobacter sp. CY351]